MTSFNSRYPVIKQYISIGNKQRPKKWYEDKQLANRKIFEEVNQIDSDQTYRTDKYIKFLESYSSSEVEAFDLLRGKIPTKTYIQENASYNIVESCVDTATSKIAKNRPKAQFLTQKGSDILQHRAKSLTRFTDGLMYANDGYSLCSQVFKDATLIGTGCVKVKEENGNVRFERVVIENIKFKETESVNSIPRVIYHIQFVNRYDLIDLYPKHEENIYISTSPESDEDLVIVIEAWKRFINGKIGTYAKVTSNAILEYEDYQDDYFPFVFFRWKKNIAGFLGRGLVEQLIPIQDQIDKVASDIIIGLDLVAKPRVFLQEGTKLSIDNQIPNIIYYQKNKTKPTFETANAFTAETYNHLKWLIQTGYDITGISQMSATSHKPADLESGAALREYSDIENNRFAQTSIDYENFVLELCKLAIKYAKKIYEKNKKLEIKAIGTSFLETIKWKDVNLEEDQYHMKAFSSALLPQTPSGRLAAIEDFQRKGYITKEKAMSLMDFPDIEASVSPQMSSDNYVRYSLERIINDKVYIPPEPDLNLMTAKEMAVQYFFTATENSLSDEIIYLLQLYKDDIDRLIAEHLQKQAQNQPIQQNEEIQQ